MAPEEECDREIFVTISNFAKELKVLDDALAGVFMLILINQRKVAAIGIQTADILAKESTDETR